MFEQSVVESTVARRSSRKALTLPISVALHFVALSGAVFAAVWNVEFPLTVPAQFEQLTDVARPVIREEKQPQKEPTRVRKPVIAPPDTPPTIVPDKVPVVAENTPPITSGEDIDTTDDAGDGFGPGIPAGDDAGFPGGVAAEAEPRQLLRPGGDVKAPVVITRVEPVYPPLAVRMRLQGIAVVECIIDRHGNVQSVKSIHATHELFRGAAETAVARWKFRPGTLNGAPVDVIFNLTVSFKLNT